MTTKIIRSNESRTPVTVIIHTLNEEINLPYALRSVLGWADQILVVDSESADQTQEIAKAAGAEVYSRSCTRKTLVEQRNWALESLPIRNEWIFILDGDEELDSEARSEISNIIATGSPGADGWWMRFKVIFQGRWIKRSTIYPTWSMRLFRSWVRYERREANAHPTVPSGREGWMTSHFLTEDRRPFEYFVSRMNEFSTLEAVAYSKVIAGTTDNGVIAGKFWGTHAERRRWLKNRFIHLPARPLVMFLYLFVLRRGFLDGRPGFDFIMYKTVSEWLITVKARERLRRHELKSAET